MSARLSSRRLFGAVTATPLVLVAAAAIAHAVDTTLPLDQCGTFQNNAGETKEVHIYTDVTIDDGVFQGSALIPSGDTGVVDVTHLEGVEVYYVTINGGGDGFYTVKCTVTEPETPGNGNAPGHAGQRGTPDFAGQPGPPPHARGGGNRR